VFELAVVGFDAVKARWKNRRAASASRWIETSTSMTSPYHRSPGECRENRAASASSVVHAVNTLDALVRLAEGRPWLPESQPAT